jgi:malate synthase
VDAARYAAYEAAAELMLALVRAPNFIDFLTLSAYQRVLKEEGLCPDKEKIAVGSPFSV